MNGNAGSATLATPDEVLEFWFAPELQPHWFASTAALDRGIAERFETTWQAAARGELDSWCATPRGALALIIVLDQFPLNIYRGQALSFSTEARARACAVTAIDRGWDTALHDSENRFLYLPFMHSETLANQERSVALFEITTLEGAAKWARHHREIIRRFGRFPHRNAILGRESTAEELDYLASPEAFKG